ncbi:MAG: hypothetical protein AB8F78_03700 [Saprospiraceae bacterium]
MKRALGIALMIIGGILTIFFKNYNGESIPYPTLLFYLSQGLAILGISIFAASRSKIERKAEDLYRVEVKRLIEHGIKIEVDLTQCEIVSSSYSEEIPRSSNLRVQGLDALGGSSNLTKRIEVNQSRLIYKAEDSSETRIFISPIIDKDEATLSFLLDSQKVTNIYVDVDTPNLYYFDLNFLTI